MKKILLAGESFFRYETHVKGYDQFYSTFYEESAVELKKALTDAGYEIEHMPSHLVPDKFPYTVEELQQYACVIISDVGANTLLLPDATFYQGRFLGNRCSTIRDYVEQGGAFLMVGGYLSFSGIDAKAHYSKTAINDILPVDILEVDDRIETPEGACPENVAEHDILKGIKEWPRFLGYNKTVLKNVENINELVSIQGNPFIAIREYGEGRTAVFTSDCAPHWGSPEFLAWEHYDAIWAQLMNWLTRNS